MLASAWDDGHESHVFWVGGRVPLPHDGVLQARTQVQV